MMRKLIYVYDALCPWCYAFTPVIKRIRDTYRDYEWEVISGGLVVGDQVKTLGGQEESEKLRRGYQQIEQRTGIRFGESFFQQIANGKIVLNSEIPATALAVFRDMKTAEDSLTFVHTLLTGLFWDGKNPNETSFYRELAQFFQLDPDVFTQKMSEESYQQLARYDFFLAKQLQAEAFPRLYLQTGETYFYLIAKGYAEEEEIVRIIEKIG